MLRPLLGALCALLVSLILAAPASAVPDGPIDVYLEHLEPLSLEWPADGTMTDGYGPRWGRMHLGIDVGILQLARRASRRERHGDRLPAGSPATRATATSSRSTWAAATRSSTRISRARTVVPGPVAGHRGADRRGRLHRLVHRHAPPFRAAPERRPDRSRAVPRLESLPARAVSSVGRAPARQAGGHWFEPSTAHSRKPC